MRRLVILNQFPYIVPVNGLIISQVSGIETISVHLQPAANALSATNHSKTFY